MPELFPPPALARLKAEARRERFAAVPYFAGLLAGEVEPLINSFAGEPELHPSVRGRVKGARAFARFVAETNAWLADRNVCVEAVDLIVTDRRTVEEVVLRLDSPRGGVELPVAIVADREPYAQLH